MARTTCDDGRGLDSNSSADTATGTKTDIGTTTLTSIGSGSSSENDSKSNAGGKNDMCDVEEAATSMIMEPKAGPLDLQCYVGDHLTLAEARKFALEEPEMWEGIDLDGNGASPMRIGSFTSPNGDVTSHLNITQARTKVHLFVITLTIL